MISGAIALEISYYLNLPINDHNEFGKLLDPYKPGSLSVILY